MEDYLRIAIFIGLLQAIEGYLLLRAAGRINIYTTITSLIEFGWVIATVYYLLTENFTTWGIAIACAYLSYNLLGWIKSKDLVKDIQSPEDMDSFRIPKAYAMASLVFGLLYSLACALTLSQ